MSHYRWLIDQIPVWEKSGLLPADVAARLRSFAEDGEKTHAAGKGESRVAQIVMGGLGALLVGSGVLALIAHNWDSVPRGLRLGGSFALMAAAQGLAAWVLRRGDTAARWAREACALFLVLAAGGCLALVSQIYNMGGDWPDFLLVWLLLAVPVMCVTRAHSCALFHLVCITVWTLSRMEMGGWGVHQPWYTSPCMYPILLAIALVYWPGLEKPGTALPNAVRWAAAVSAIIGLCVFTIWMGEHGSDRAAGWPLMLTVAAIAMLPLSQAAIDERLSRKPQVVMGSLALFGAAFFCSTEWGARRLVESLEKSVGTAWCWVLLALFVAFAVIALLQRRWALAAVGSLALTPLLAVALMQMHAKPDLSWAFTVQLFAIGLVMIVAEFFGAKGSPRFGALLLAVLILVRMGDSELSLITKSVVFIVTGLAFIVFNFMWSRASVRKEAAP